MIKDFKTKAMESDAQLVKLGAAARVGPSLSFLNSGTFSPGSERLKQSSSMQQKSSSSAPSNVDQALRDMVNDIRKVHQFISSQVILKSNHSLSRGNIMRF